MADDDFSITEDAGVAAEVVRLDERRRKRATAGGGGKGGKPERKSDAPRSAGRDSPREAAVEAMLEAGAIFWRDERGDVFATVEQSGRIERYPVRSRDFRNLTRLVFGDAYPVQVPGRPDRPGSLPDQALNEVVASFEALGLRAPVRSPRPRVCRDGEGAIWIDLAGADWSLVKVTGDGWGLVAAADVPLIRPSGLMPLPAPERIDAAAGLAQLAGLLNLRPGKDGAPSADLMLVVAWLIGCLHPVGPCPILSLDGEQGSGKSTTARMLRRLVDANAAENRAAPREERDLLLAARNSRVLSLDNLSSLSAEMADSLCRISTGGGFGERALFTNNEENVIFVQNPILLNGINSLLSRGDLADRAISINLPEIPDDKRKPEEQIWSEFEAARPGLLGLLLDGLSCALRRLPGLQLERSPRMADFAKLAVAAAPAFGWGASEMLAALEANRAAASVGVVEDDGVAAAVQALVEEQGRWTGTATELLAVVNEKTPLARQRQRGWPTDGTRLGHKLRRVAPALRRVGVEVVLPTSAGRGGRVYTLERRAPPPPAGAQSPQPAAPWEGEL
ncbi:hypothetical protein [Pseudoroseomonas cervicalis]|uniref:hypothetical protein n=1 Tax=Teichococcus cervicalis TaxID=204525 RepID=UPI0022F1A3C8|nr:hypothetical protein [Pseudoroseomonas cervicalis]WBV44020.1 hypothetical protein PFY06_05485 [Pseudoroseomonas cervicalis]